MPKYTQPGYTLAYGYEFKAEAVQINSKEASQS